MFGGLTNLVDGARAAAHKVGDAARHAAAQVTPIHTESKFMTHGVFMPEEFVEAGDQLVKAFPTWQWVGINGNCKHVNSSLPTDKQYLITRSVPCEKRVRELEKSVSGLPEVDGEDGWAVTGEVQEGRKEEEEDVQDIQDAVNEQPPPPAEEEVPVPKQSDYADEFAEIDGMMSEFIVADSAQDSQIQKIRRYDLTITWDPYYQTPRMWLYGLSEYDGITPLSPEEIFEDVLTDYAKKTVTVDEHPHTGVPTCSIHPCKHAIMMKKIADRWIEDKKNTTNSQAMKTDFDLSNEEWKQFSDAKVRGSLVVFLKFISSVIPTINYDFTSEGEFAVTG